MLQKFNNLLKNHIPIHLLIQALFLVSGASSAAVFFLLKSVPKSAHVFSNVFLEKSKTYLDV